MEDAQRRCSGRSQRAGGFLFAGTRSRSIAAPGRRRIMGGGNGSEERPAAANPAGREEGKHLYAPRNQMKSGPPFHGDCESRSEEHTSELQSLTNLVCRLLLEKKKKTNINIKT